MTVETPAGDSGLKMLVILCAGSRREEIRRLIEEHEIHGYTEIPEAYGSGTTGRHLGTRAWPGSSALIMVAVNASRIAGLMDALEAKARAGSPEEGLRALVLPVERMI